jgi:hypothetical protein
MAAIVRSILAVLLGVVLGVVLIGTIEALSHLVYSSPPGVDLHDHQAMRAAMDKIPVGALLSVVLAWVGGSGGGSWLAARIAGRSPVLHGMIVGSVFLLVSMAVMLMIPHPVWFSIVAVATVSLATFLGAKLGSRPRSDRLSPAG